MRGAYLRVGALALLAGGLLLGLLLFLGSGKARHGQPYESYFRDSVQGLDVGGAVKYQGVGVGQVTGIGLVNAEYAGGASRIDQDPAWRQVLVRFEVDASRVGALPAAADMAAKGLRARIAPQGLTGQSYVELDFMDPARAPAAAPPWTPRDPWIPSAQSTLSQVTDSATALLARLQAVDIAALASGMVALIGDLRAILHDGDMHGLVAEAGGTLRLLHAGLEAADIPGLAADLRGTLAATRALAQGPQTRDLLRAATLAVDRLTQATARLPQLLATLQDVARRADGGAADTQAGLVPLLRDARAAVAALRATTEAVRRDPSQVVLQGPPPRGLAR